MSAMPTLGDRYAAAVAAYLAGGGETALHAAYEVGREAVQAGIGPLILFSIHRDLLNRLWDSSRDPAELTRDATAVFTETLAPFQMAYAGLDDARGAVAELGALIKQQADDLDQLTGGLDELKYSGEPLRRLRSMVDRHLSDLDRFHARLERVRLTADARRTELSSIVSAQEQERHRLASEIHDDALQAMAAVLIRLGMAGRRISDPDQRAVISKLEAGTREAIARLRRLLVDLQPPELERVGLVDGVRALLNRLEEEFEIGYTLTDRLEHEPGPEVQTISFRIIQEALANVRKHARAHTVQVELETIEGGLRALVADDGTGFDVHAVAEQTPPGHLGLPTMRERAQLAGGRLSIETGASGTRVELWMPNQAGGES